MRILFDHIVFFVGDLDRAVHDFQSKGFHVVYGGSHPMWGTYNALIYFDDIYIELIAIENEDVYSHAAKVPYTLHESYEKRGRQNGFTRYAIRTEDIQNIADAFNKSTFDVIGPEPFSRKTNSGEIIQWDLLHIGSDATSNELPFIIDWRLNDTERMNSLKEKGVIATHKNTVIKMKKITFFVNNPLSLSEFFDKIKTPYKIYGNSLLIKFNNVEVEYVLTTSSNDAIIEFTSENMISPFVYEQTEFKFNSTNNLAT